MSPIEKQIEAQQSSKVTLDETRERATVALADAEQEAHIPAYAGASNLLVGDAYSQEGRHTEAATAAHLRRESASGRRRKFVRVQRC